VLKDKVHLGAAAVVAGVLLAGGAGLFCSGFGVGWFLHRGFVIPVICQVAAAVGVIGLLLYVFMLCRSLTSIARLLAPGRAWRYCGGDNGFIGGLSRAIERRINQAREQSRLLEKQIGNLQIQLRLLRHQKTNTEAIIHSIRDVVIVADEFGKLLMANEAALNLFGLDPGNCLHRSIEDVFDDSKSRLVELLRQTLESKGRATRCELQFENDGQVRSFDAVVSCICDASQRRSQVVAVLHDVTREKEVSQMKNDFVSAVSHELKTPLASITAYSEMLADGEADSEQSRKEFANVIQHQADRLNRMIEDLLNTARIESGLIKVVKEPVSLAVLVEEQRQMMSNCAEEKEITISGLGGEGLIVFEQVYADRDMISRVIINLLSNAIKYTRRGGSVQVALEVDEVEAVARLSVTDTGVGIEADELEHVFDKFYRVKSHRSQAKGTGLGLNLVKQIVEKVHNGRVFASSEPGVGSTFGFELPLCGHRATVGSR